MHVSLSNGSGVEAASSVCRWAVCSEMVHWE